MKKHKFKIPFKDDENRKNSLAVIEYIDNDIIYNNNNNRRNIAITITPPPSPSYSGIPILLNSNELPLAKNLFYNRPNFLPTNVNNKTSPSNRSISESIFQSSRCMLFVNSK